MSEFRWLLLAAGILILAAIFWVTRREAAGKAVVPPVLLRRKAPRLDAPEAVLPAPEAPVQKEATAAPPAGRVITVRLVGQGSSSFAGENLAAALQESGLRHGKFGIFHRLGSESQVVFSVASLVEPGTFEPAAMAAERFPGVTLFLSLGTSGDRLAAFDDMLSTARSLAGKLGGELLDERGSRLSVQRERYLREEVIQFQHKPPAS